MDWVRYANQGATRSQPLDPRLVNALGFLPELGLTMEVFSGGQPAAGQGPRVGSTRHDHGNAADAFFYQGDRRLDWANPADLPLFEAVVQRARANGVTGFGAGPGYMQPGSMHIGFGNPGVWGAGGSGSTAPDWLRRAYGAAPAGGAPATPQLSFGASMPAAVSGAQAMAAGQMPNDATLNFGTPALADMFAGPRQQQQPQRQQAAQEKARAEDERRRALLDGLGSYFS